MVASPLAGGWSPHSQPAAATAAAPAAPEGPASGGPKRRRRGGRRGNAVAATALADADAAPQTAGKRRRGRSGTDASTLTEARAPKRGRHGSAAGTRATTPLLRPRAPKNSSQFLMRSAVLGLAAPLVSPPQTTPGFAPSALRFGADADTAGPVLAAPAWGSMAGLDAWGSNIGAIRPAHGPAVAAASSAGADGEAVPDPAAADEGAVNGLVFVGAAQQEAVMAALQAENETLRRRLAAAEAALAAAQQRSGAGEASAALVGTAD